MRVYDPRDDLPPHGAKVYALFEVESLTQPVKLHAMVDFDAYEGWLYKKSRIKVLKWADYQMPILCPEEVEKLETVEED